MKSLLASTAIAAAVLAAASAASAFPGVNNDPGGPALVITFAPNGSISTAATGQPIAYDNGGDDAYIGVVNNSGKTITDISLAGPSIGFFDGDGIDVYGIPGNAIDKTTYGGPDAYFTNNLGSAVTVNFIGGIASGSTDYFSLEAPASLSLTVTGVPEPTTWALMLMGVAGIGYAARRRRTAFAAA